MSVVECLSASDFKSLFARNFPYLPLYVSGKAYFKDDVVYVKPNFYVSLKDDNTDPVTNTSSWAIANDSVDNYVSDKDIRKAWGEATVSFNEALFGECEETKTAFLYLVAFYLAYDLSLAQTGAYGAIGFPATEVRVGSVSEGYYIPKVYLENPVLGFYARNGFGLKYLNMVYPKLVGNVGVVAGWSLP